MSEIKANLSTSSISNEAVEEHADVNNSGQINQQSALKDEVKKASFGDKLRNFFYHPATIVIGSLLTGPLLAIGLGIDTLVRHLTEPSALAKLDPQSTEMPKITSTKDLLAFLKVKCKQPDKLLVPNGESL